MRFVALEEARAATGWKLVPTDEEEIDMPCATP
jgi:hypothetical protein